MSDRDIFKRKEPNPVTHVTHQREVFWQITLPLVLGVLVILALAGLTIAAGIGLSPATSTWASISLIWLILPGLIIVLVLIVFLSSVIYGIIRLEQVLPVYARQVQDFFYLVQRKIRQGADRVVQPVIKVSEWWEGLQVVFKKTKPTS